MPAPWIPGYAIKACSLEKPCLCRAFLLVAVSIQVIAPTSARAFFIAASTASGVTVQALKEQMLRRRQTACKSQVLSQIFHTNGHRMEAAKGLAPHARFGGLLFACDLSKPTAFMAIHAQNGFGAWRHIPYHSPITLTVATDHHVSLSEGS